MNVTVNSPTRANSYKCGALLTHQRTRDKVRSLLPKLSEQERTVIERRYALGDMNEPSLTHPAIAKILRVDYRTCAEIEKRALAHLTELGVNLDPFNKYKKTL